MLALILIVYETGLVQSQPVLYCMLFDIFFSRLYGFSHSSSTMSWSSIHPSFRTISQTPSSSQVSKGPKVNEKPNYSFPKSCPIRHCCIEKHTKAMKADQLGGTAGIHSRTCHTNSIRNVPATIHLCFVRSPSLAPSKVQLFFQDLD